MHRAAARAEKNAEKFHELSSCKPNFINLMKRSLLL
jgi:hypothetical protein